MFLFSLSSSGLQAACITINEIKKAEQVESKSVKDEYNVRLGSKEKSCVGLIARIFIGKSLSQREIARDTRMKLDQC